MRLQAVYLSGAPYNNQTFYNPFSAVPKLSANNPGFTALKLPSSQYTTNNDNTISITIPPTINTGYIDVIIQNPAGYGVFSRCVIKDSYSGQQTQQELRPWSSGIQVLPEPVYVEPEPLPPPPISPLSLDYSLITSLLNNFTDQTVNTITPKYNIYGAGDTAGVGLNTSPISPLSLNYSLFTSLLNNFTDQTVNTITPKYNIYGAGDTAGVGL
jgi:hypothetical protein